MKKGIFNIMVYWFMDYDVVFFDDGWNILKLFLCVNW